MKQLMCALCIVLAVLFWTTTGTAQETEQAVPQKDGKVCNADIERYCKGIRPLPALIWACLKGNEDRISEGCRAFLVRTQESAQEFRQACQQDIQKFCKGVRPDMPRLIFCLKTYAAELSEPCKAYLKKQPQN